MRITKEDEVYARYLARYKGGLEERHSPRVHMCAFRGECCSASSPNLETLARVKHSQQPTEVYSGLTAASSSPRKLLGRHSTAAHLTPMRRTLTRTYANDACARRFAAERIRENRATALNVLVQSVDRNLSLEEVFLNLVPRNNFRPRRRTKVSPEIYARCVKYKKFI